MAAQKYKAYNRIVTYLYLFPSYLVWHYSSAFRDITRVWTNFLWFTYNFFSLPLLVKTFFAPWKRLHEERAKGAFSLEDIASVIVTNTVMRFVGALMRTAVLFVGTIFVLLVFWVGLIFYVAWVFLPVLCVWSFLYGLSVLVM